jgi:hypothetical protein
MINHRILPLFIVPHIVPKGILVLSPQKRLIFNLLLNTKSRKLCYCIPTINYQQGSILCNLEAPHRIEVPNRITFSAIDLDFVVDGHNENSVLSLRHFN